MKTILLIENKSDILENLKEAFEMEGYQILSANTGLKGIELAREFIPDLVISAIQIGKIDGYEVLRLLLEARKTSKIPFIFSTTKFEQSDRTLAMDLGANDYIVKPYELEDIFAMAKLWINSGRNGVKDDFPSHEKKNDVAVRASLVSVAA